MPVVICRSMCNTELAAVLIAHMICLQHRFAPKDPDQRDLWFILVVTIWLGEYAQFRQSHFESDELACTDASVTNRSGMEPFPSVAMIVPRSFEDFFGFNHLPFLLAASGRITGCILDCLFSFFTKPADHKRRCSCDSKHGRVKCRWWNHHANYLAIW